MNPLNWPAYRRLSMTFLISMGGLVSLMSASMIAPALTEISSDLNMDMPSTSLIVSIYLLAFGFGPLVLGPMSEIFGRRKIWLASHAFFLLWNTLCPVGKSKELLLIARFLSGLGGSVGLAIPGPIMVDIWPISQRGTSVALSMFMPYLGAAIGPIVGGYTAQYLGYAWTFWIVSIVDAVILILSLVANLFGSYALALTTYAEIWTRQYSQTVSISGLHYIAISVGSAGSSQVTGYLTDIVWSHLKKKAGGTHTPEFRVPLMFPGTILMPLGLLLYGWAAEKKLFWLVTDIGMVIFVFGLMSTSQCCNTYIADEFAEQYASANAAYRFVSSIVGFCFPLFARNMYDALGYGWGNTLLTGGFLVVAAWIPLVLWKKGARIREIGRERKSS